MEEEDFVYNNDIVFIKISEGNKFDVANKKLK